MPVGPNFSSDTWPPKLPAHTRDDLRWPPVSSTHRIMVSAPEFSYAPTSTSSSLRQELNSGAGQDSVPKKTNTVIFGGSLAALATPPLTADWGSDGSSQDDMGSDADSEASSGTASASGSNGKALRHPLLCPPAKPQHDFRRLLDARPSHEIKAPAPKLSSVTPASRRPPVGPRLATPRSLDKCSGPALAGVPRLNTAYLTPHTHKIGSGNVTVLPSLSLLVDLREGERRKGRKGHEVLVISSNGEDIKVYGAPHLSTPCCLVEPVAQHDVNDLPASYRKQYETAAKVVSGLKERIPKVCNRFATLSYATLML